MFKFKKFFIIVAIIISSLFMNSLNVNAYYTYYDFIYAFNSKSSIFIKQCSSREPVTIPDEIDGLIVTEIGEYACCNDLKGDYNKELIENGIAIIRCCDEIIIPKTITKIGRYAIGYDKIVVLIYGEWENQVSENYYKSDETIIRGYKGTAAETYAKENGFIFVALDDEPQVTTATTATTQTTTTSTTVSTTTTSKATTETTKSTTSTTTSSTTITTNSTTAISTSSSTSGSTTLSTTSTSIDTTTNLTTPLTTTSTSVTTSETTSITTTHVKGDANGDNKLDIRDAAFIAQKIALDKASELPKCADFNDDGTVNVRDAAAIARYLASNVKK